MAKIVGISGSLRQGSFNSALLHAAAASMPSGSSLTIATIAGIPLYNGDEEQAHGLPPAVIALKEAIAGADGLLIATPEYNNSIPGVLKNAIDWATRPADDIARVFGAKPTAIIGASPGGFGTILAQQAWLAVMHTLGVKLWNGGRLMVSRAGKVFDGDGQITDDAIAGMLTQFITGFVAEVERAKSG